MISWIQRRGTYRRQISGFVNQVVFSIGGELLPQSGKNELSASSGKKKENLLTNSPLLSPPRSPPTPPLSNCFSEVQTGHKFRGKANLKQTNQLGRWRLGIKICVFYASGERELLTGGYWRRRNGLLYDVSTPIPSLKEILPIIACTGRLRWKGAPCSGFR